MLVWSFATLSRSEVPAGAGGLQFTLLEVLKWCETFSDRGIEA